MSFCKCFQAKHYPPEVKANRQSLTSQVVDNVSLVLLEGKPDTGTFRCVERG